MTYKRDDNEVPIPLIRPNICEKTDNERTTTTLQVTTVNTSTGSEEYSKFKIRVYSGAQHEDLIALLVTISQFKSWAETKGVWETPASTNATTVFTEWKKCLAGLASQNWLELETRLAPSTTTKTFTRFKNCLSGFIVKKVAHDDDAYFTEQEYLQERSLPSGMTFNEYFDRLLLYSNYMMWLLDANQIIRLKNLRHAFPFEREAAALDLLWKVPSGATDPTGCFDEGQLVSIILRTMPDPWITQARLQSVTHRTPLREVCSKMATYCALSRRLGPNRLATNVPQNFAYRGGGRRNSRGGRGGRNNNRNYGRYNNNNYQRNNNQQYRNQQYPIQQQQPNYYGNNQQQQYNYQRQQFNQQQHNFQHYRSQSRAPLGAQRYGNRTFGRGGRFSNRGGRSRGREQHYLQAEPPVPPQEENHLHDTVEDENEAYYDAIESSDDYLAQEQSGSEQQYFMDPYDSDYNPIIPPSDEFNALTDVGYTFDDPPHGDCYPAQAYEEPYVQPTQDPWADISYDDFDQGYGSLYGDY